eukprot:SAG31_NODE_12926_length_906_cov_0.863693_2_plen_168_part_01
MWIEGLDKKHPPICVRVCLHELQPQVECSMLRHLSRGRLIEPIDEILSFLVVEPHIFRPNVFLWKVLFVASAADDHAHDRCVWLHGGTIARPYYSQFSDIAFPPVAFLAANKLVGAKTLINAHTVSRLVPCISRSKSRISRIVAQKRESNPLPGGMLHRHLPSSCGEQ